MNYYQARQILDGPNQGRWHYTCRNDDWIYAVGYCSPNRSCSLCDAKHVYPADPDCPECRGKGLVPLPNPCPGHDTPEEAAAHYKDYLLDERLRFSDDRPDADTLHRCQDNGCEEMTSGGASVGAYMHWYLCAAHRNQKTVSELMGEIGSSIES